MFSLPFRDRLLISFDRFPIPVIYAWIAAALTTFIRLRFTRRLGLRTHFHGAA